MTFKTTIQRFLLPLFLFIFTFSSAQVGLNWATTSSANFTSDSATFTAMAVSKANGHIYVAYRDADASNKLTVSRFNGTSWSILGTAGISTGAVSNCAIAVSGNIVYVAYSESTSSNRLRVRRYNGSTWSDDGAGTIRDASYISIAISTNGNVYASCLDEGYAGGAGRVIVFERNASTNTWANITGTGGLSAGTSTSIDMDVDYLGDVYVLYRDANASNKATVKKYDLSATTWSTIGTEGFSAGAVSSCAIKVDKVGNPVISFVDASISNALKIYKRNGSVWADVTGTLGVTGTNAENKLYITRDNNVVVGFKAGTGAFTIYKHDALSNTWDNLGNPKGNTTTASDIGLDTDISDKLFVCYTEPTQGFKANVRQLNCIAPPKPTITPSNTVMCGGDKISLQSSNNSSNVTSLWNRSFDNYETHSAKLSELNDSDDNNAAMSAATSPIGELWVVKTRKTTNEIVVKRFSNNEWVQVGSVITYSDGETDGNATDIAFHPDGTCYVSFTISNGDIGIVKWNGTAWVTENFGWSTLSDTCKHTAISINPYGVIALATSMKQASTGDYRPIIFTKLNGVWRSSTFLNYDAGSLDVAVDMDGNALLIVSDENEKSPAVSHAQKHGKIRVVKLLRNNVFDSNLLLTFNRFGHYTQVECSYTDNTVYFGFRKEKAIVADDRTADGFRLFNNSNTLSYISAGLCEYAFTMGVSKAGKLFFVNADNYGAGTVLITGINTGANFAGIVSNYFQNNSISTANTYYRGLQMVFDQNDAPIIVTSTAVPNTTTHGDFRVYRVDRVGLGAANPLLTNKAGMYFTESNTGCGAVDTSSIVTLTKTAEFNNWTGAANGNWNVSGNWGCFRLPNANDVVSIPTALSNYPTLTSSVPAANRIVNSLLIGSNAGVTIDGVSLVLKDSISVASTSSITTINNGYLEFAGTAIQNTNNLQRVNGNIRINNPSNLILDRNLNVTGGIDFATGRIITNNYTLRAAHNLLTGTDANSYIATSLQSGADATSGGFITSIPAGGATQFPVGTLTSYNPVSISNTSGAADSVTVVVDAAPIVTANSNRHLNVTWNLTEKNAGNNTYGLTFFWNTANEGSLFSRSACGVVRSNGGSTINFATTPGSATTVSSNFYSRTATGVTGLSPWSVSSEATILPIELLNFSAALQSNNTVVLNWVISNSSNPKQFIIQYSTDGIQFEDAGTVQGTIATQYQFAHTPNVQNGYTYYRLKMLDNDGITSFSSIATVKMNNALTKSVQVYPQPSFGLNNYATIFMAAKATVQIQIVNAVGKTVVTNTVQLEQGNNTITLPTQSLSSGIYTLRLLNNNSTIVTQGFLK